MMARHKELQNYILGLLHIAVAPEDVGAALLARGFWIGHGTSSSMKSLNPYTTISLQPDAQGQPLASTEDMIVLCKLYVLQPGIEIDHLSWWLETLQTRGESDFVEKYQELTEQPFSAGEWRKDLFGFVD